MPKIVRDALLLLAPPVLVWVAQDLVPVLQHDNPNAAALVAGAVGLLTLILTPLEKSYGVGQKPQADSPGDGPV